MNEIVDIVTLLRASAQRGSRAERRLAEAILADLDRASKASIAELAGAAGVSEPTVTRFCRAIGCEGVRDLKFHLAQALAIGGPYLGAAPAFDGGAPGDRRLSTAICGGAVAAIERVRETADLRRIEAAGRRVATARSVLAYGSGGGSSMVATEMHNRLFRLGILVTAHADGQMQRMTASMADEGTAVLAFSTSGFARSVVDAVAIARQYGAWTCAVTAPGSALARAADAVIPFVVAEDPNVYKPTSSRYGLLAVADMIAMAAAEALGPPVLEGLRRIKQSLNALKVNDPRLPIGD